MRNGVPPSGTDVLYLHDLKIDCIIGIWAWERQTRQRIILDLDIAVDIQKAALHDNIQYALDYKGLADRVTAFVSASEFFLVEALIEHVAQLVLREYAVPWVRARIKKPSALGRGAEVGLIIERYQKEGP